MNVGSIGKICVAKCEEENGQIIIRKNRIPVLPTKRATRGRKRAKRVKWKSSKGIEK
jgi:hypothetical protein